MADEKKESPIYKLARFIVDKRKAFYLVFLAACLFCAASISKVEVNNDITSYLPPETETRRGLSLMEEEFTTLGSARVMAANITYEQAARLAEALEEVEGVAGVVFDGTEDHYQNASALFDVSFEEENDTEGTSAALAEGESRLANLTPSQDVDATRRCLAALREDRRGLPQLDCGESGSTLRFLLPLALVLRGGGVFTGRGRLMDRPQRPYFDLFDEKGIRYDQKNGILTVEGRLTPGTYRLPGNVSSQFVTGLLYAAKSRAQRRRIRRTGPTWGCGFTAPNVRMQYTGESFAEGLQSVAASVAPRSGEGRAVDKSELFPAAHNFDAEHKDRIDALFAAWWVEMLRRINRQMMRLRTGKVNHYVLFALLFLVTVFLLSVFNLIR